MLEKTRECANMAIYKSPKAVIESTPSPAKERMFLKYPTSETRDITDYSRSNEKETYPDKTRLASLLRPDVRFTHIHTHPHDPTPSVEDLKVFMLSDDIRTMVIAARNPQTGKVERYNVIKKTKATPKFGRSFDTVGFSWSAFNVFRNPPLILGNKMERQLCLDLWEYWDLSRFELMSFFTNPLGDFMRTYSLHRRRVVARENE
jgi:hypothetical protein